MSTPLTDQIANISPLWVVAIVTIFTLIRVALARADQPWARAVSETCDTINFVLILAFLLVRPFVAQAFYIPSESMENTLLTGDRLIVDKFSYRLREPQRSDVVVFNAPPEATDERQDGIDFIKRLIAGPGETVEIRAASVRIGDLLITEDPYSGQTAHDNLRGYLGIGTEESIKFFPDHILIGGQRRMSKEEIAAAAGYPGAPVEITPGRTIVNGETLREDYTREDPGYSYPPTRLEKDQYFMLGDNRNRSRDSHVWGALDRSRVVGKAIVIFWPIPRGGTIH